METNPEREPAAPRDERVKPSLPPLGARTRLRFGLPSLPGWRGELVILAGFALAAVVLTWPIAITLGKATGLRGDYFNNIWNAWWVQQVVSEGASPFFTDHLYYPEGLSLKRHTLSPLNAIPAAGLAEAFGPHVAFNLWLLATLALSGWAFSLFAREGTGSTAGGVLGGLVYAFNPFHFFYICQVNVFTWQYLPLALLFFVRVYREGGWRNAALAALFTGCITASTEYFVIYAVLVVGLLLLCGRWLARDVPWVTGARRLLAAGAATGLVVLVVGAPLLYGTLVERGPDSSELSFQTRRANDLLGYYWIGGPEVAIVSWPTMLGYSTLLLVLLGVRRWRRQLPWLVVGGVFLLMSLGKSLHVNQEDTGVKLLYHVLVETLHLSMLRKPDRSFLMVQFVVALLVAESWVALRARLKSVRSRTLAWGACALLTMGELTGVPFQRYDVRTPAYFEELASEQEVTTLLDLPPMNIDVQNARYMLYQTVHGKKIPLGYCTALALDRQHTELHQVMTNGFIWWLHEGRRVLPNWLRERGIDRLVLHTTRPGSRPSDPEVHGRVFYEPFFLVRRKLLDIRQSGQFVDEPVPDLTTFRTKGLISQEFGQPIHQDDEVVVWDLTKR